MSRYLFGGTAADVTTLTSGRVAPGAEGTAWTDRVGGTQVLDLATLTGDTTTVVTSGERGEVLFYGPDGVRSDMWLDFGLGYRFLIRPVNISGLSAYEVAVAEGYTGDEAEWLESLRSTLPGPTGDLAYWWRGAWSAVPYVEGDVVTHDGSTWVAHRDTTSGEEPGGAAAVQVVGEMPASGSTGGGSLVWRWQAFTVTAETLATHVRARVPGSVGSPLTTLCELRNAAGDVLATYIPAGFTTDVALSAPVLLSPGTTYYISTYASTWNVSTPLPTPTGVVSVTTQQRNGAWPGTLDSDASYYQPFSISATPGNPWVTLAEKGDQGDQGGKGDKGDKGDTGDWSGAQTLNAQTGDYTLLTADAGKLVTVDSGSAAVVTVNGSLDLSPGQRIDMLALGAGAVSVQASGATVNATPGLKLRTRYSAATLLCVAADVYVLLGDLDA